MADIDAVVVGSGISGLAAALGLARRGRSVTLIEASDEVGGMIRSVERDGYSFDVGLHYVGKLGPGEFFRAQLDELGLEHVEFVELDPDGFDRYVFPDFEISLCKGRDRFTRRLIERFPTEAQGIGDFFDLVARVDEALVPSELSHHGFLATLRYLRRHPVLFRYGRQSFSRVLEHFVSDPRLAAVLSAPLFDVGLGPSRVSGLVALGLWGYFIGGAYYPRGGGGALRDAFTEALRFHGARVMTSAPVLSLCKRDGDWITTLADGRSLDSSVVVSTVDPRLTLGTLVDPELVGRRQRRKAESLRPSAAVFFANIGTDLDLPALGITSANIAHSETWDVDEYFAAWQSPTLRLPIAFFMSSNSVKDPRGGHAPAGRHTLQILGGASYELFEPWADIPEPERGDAYHDLVHEIGARLVTAAERYVPGLSNHLELVDYRSPLFLANRVGALRGGIYGPEQTPDQVGFGRYPALEAGVDGLFLAGAGTLGASVAMSCSSGALAAELADRHLDRLAPVRLPSMGTWS